MAADLHTKMSQLSLTGKGIFNLTKGLSYTAVTIDANVTACSNPSTLHATEAEDIALALMMKMKEKMLAAHQLPGLLKLLSMKL